MESMIDDFGISETALKQVKYQIRQGKKNQSRTQWFLIRQHSLFPLSRDGNIKTRHNLMEFISYSCIGYTEYILKSIFASKIYILQKWSQQTDKEIYWYIIG